MGNTCEYFRAFIDHPGRASNDEHEALAEHVRTCSECTQYASTAAVTAALFDHARQSVSDGAIESAYRRLIDRSGQERRQTWLAILMAVTSLLALVWFVSHERAINAGSVILMLWFLASVVYAWWTSAVARRLSGYDHSSVFLAAWQRDLTRKINLTRMVAGVIGLEILAGALIMLFRGPPAQGAPILFGLGLVLGIGVLYTYLVELPLLKMERSLISEED